MISLNGFFKKRIIRLDYYEIKKNWEKKGYICIRSAGSHSFADLVCVHPIDKYIFFIQVKPKNFSKKAEQRLLKGHQVFNDEFICEYIVQ